MGTGEWRGEAVMRREKEREHMEHREHNKDSKTNTDKERRMRSCPCLCVHMAKRAGAEKRPTHWDKPLCSGFLLRVIWQLGPHVCWQAATYAPNHLLIAELLHFYFLFFLLPFNTIGWFAGVLGTHTTGTNNFTFITGVKLAGIQIYWHS